MKSLFYLSNLRIFLFISFTAIINISNAQTDDDSEWEEIILNSDSSYTDGKDIIFIIDDTIPIIDSLAEGMRLLPVTSGAINITLGSSTKTINRGLYGIHIGGMFDNTTLPNDGSSDYGWQWLIDLAPEVLRFPSGSYSKFMHLLHDPYSGTNSIGYGYNLFEIARYFDWTDGKMDFDFSALSSSDIINILYDNENDLEFWINANNVDHYTNFRKKCFTQTCETRRYIDDFIELVNRIDSTYPGRPQTKVILDLNILSETATECRAIADYLRSHNVNVVGVEMGNETYTNFFCDAMEFHDFNDYYTFINGTNLSGNEHVLRSVSGTTTDMWDDHDFITKFKTGGGFNYKIGVCGIPLGEDFAFRLNVDDSSCASTTAWNDSLRNKYTEKVSGSSKYKFDAVIMHTYYEPENYKDIPIENLDSIPTCSGTGDLWDYDTFDPRLEDAFNKIIGIGGVPGNFRDFLVRNTGDYKAYKISFDEFNNHLSFDLTTAEKKDLWITEGNLKTQIKGTGLTELAKTKVDIYTNGFTHAHLLMQWYLKNIKINFDNDYRTNFFTYFTVQNFAGGTSTDLVSTSDGVERDHFEISGCPYGSNCGEGCYSDTTFDKRNYHVRRTTYFVTYLFSEINKQSLKYLPSIYGLGHSNINLPPTSFIDNAKENVYIYFTNVNGDYQNYIIDPDNLLSLFPAAGYVELGESSVTFLQAKQLYSTSGKSAMFDTLINYCYNTNDHPFEITPTSEDGLDPTIITTDNVPQCTSEGLPLNGCLSAPSYSIGYFKIPITAFYPPPRLGEIQQLEDINIYPNPATSYISINPLYENSQNILIDYSVTILNMEGGILLKTSSQRNQPIDITKLAAGCYQVIISNSENKFNKKLIITE